MSLARDLRGGVTQQELATIESTAGALVVRTDSGRYRALRAVSCLVEPRADDLVLVTAAEDGRCWVLAVLERDAKGATLSVDGDLHLRPEGRIHLSSRRGIGIDSAQDVTVQTARVDVNALEGTVVVQGLRYLGRRLRTEVEKVKAIASTFDSVVDRFSLQAKRSYRRVEELDQLRAETIDHVADKTVHIRAKNAVVTAEQLVKVDGDQVHLG